MTLNTILVQTNIDYFAEHPVKIAADLASRFRANVIGVCACAIQPLLTDAAAVGVPTIMEDPNDIEKQLQSAGARFREVVAPVHRPADWRSSIDFPTDHAALQARAADLIVIGPSRGGSLYRKVDQADLIMVAGRAVLFVPEGQSQLAGERVIVGWKDTREARRAVLDSLPLLEKAAEVTVATVTEEEDSDALHSADDVVRYLQNHQVNARCLRVEAKGRTGSRIIALAKDLDADLIVAGAYGHSRLREWIFGGVTRDLLTHSPICCLMAN